MLDKPSSDQVRRRSFAATSVAVGAWLLAVLAAMLLLTSYSNTPGGAGSPPVRWPAGSLISLDTHRPTLVMFAHPRCPCTRSSLGELELLMTRCHDRLTAHVVFLRPAGTAADWTTTDLWRQAAAIPGVTVHQDDSGNEARRFGAETSGQTLLYSPDGTLMFQGGITIARGHSGDNPGRDALVALVEHGPSSQLKTPVFGCGLTTNNTLKEDVQ